MLKPYQIKIIIPVLYALAGISYSAWVITQTTPNIWQYIGASIATVFFILWIIARVQLANNFSIGAKANELVTVGLYGKFRHPVYYFSTAALGGVALVSQNWLVALAWMALVILEVIRIPSEERVLQEKFGNTYIEYKKRSWF